MNAQQLEIYLNSLGKPHSDLVAGGVVSANGFKEAYPGALSKYLAPLPGLNLRFWAESEAFESLIFTLVKITPSEVVFEQELPQPYDECINRESTLRTLDEPIESKGPFKMPMPIGEVGGWDKFSLARYGHKDLVVIVKYDVLMNVVALSFSLIKTGYDSMVEGDSKETKS